MKETQLMQGSFVIDPKYGLTQRHKLGWSWPIRALRSRDRKGLMLMIRKSRLRFVRFHRCGATIFVEVTK